MQFELTKDFLDILNFAVEENNEAKVLELIDGLQPADIAEIIDEQSLEEAIAFYQFFSQEQAADILIELDEDSRERILNSLSSEEIAKQFIDNMDSDDAADVLAELTDEKKNEVISHLEDFEQASDIVDLLSYEEDTAGGLMAKELFKVDINWDIKTCINELRKQSQDIEQVYTVYVVDDKNILQGIVSLKRLLLTPDNKKIKDIYKDNIISVKVDVKDEEVGNIMDKYDLVVVPVVDEIGRLLGRITIDDVVEVIKEEAEKDYQMASGISENVESSDSIWLLTRARIPWLFIGLFGGIISARVIGNYESVLGIHPEMAFFIPLIAAMAGNVGVQSSAIVVQGLANNSLGMDGVLGRLFKELMVALLNGVILSSLIFGYNFLFSDNMSLSLTVSISLLSVIVFAGLFGTVIPLALNKYKIDPALATGPFITTTNDIFGLFLYFTIGHLMYT
ncbi:MAG: magnesium transporter [Flavobacteriales bacterium]|jgi:magnesium transporter|nr:magnesium transporter [Flavobacteriales bacterium]MCB9364375.1 magnesium transporter [Flavobacteriales bacterium]